MTHRCETRVTSCGEDENVPPRMDEISGGSCPPASEVSLKKSHAMTKDTIRKIGNAIASFSDPFNIAVDEVFAEPIFRLPRQSRSNVRLDRNALKKHFNVFGRHVLDKYDAALAKGADPDESFLQCAEGLAAIAGVDTGMDFVQDGDLTFGIIQYVINRAEALAYIDYFWDYLGGRTVEIDERRLENWFLAPDSPRNRFRGCHCLMDDVTMGRAVRDYRKAGTNEVIA